VLAFDPGLRMDAYGIITRQGHVLPPSAQAMLESLRETIAQDPLLKKKRA
jgi:hypothetical protein